MLIKNIIIVFSFFTTIKMPFIKFEKDNYKFLPLLIFLVGIFIGVFVYFIYFILNFINITSYLKSILIVISFIVLTGGLHFDGFLDVVDAHFSRKDIDKKLEIMKDSNVGAFALIAFACFILLKVSIINELFIKNTINASLIFIPIYSRVVVSYIICSNKFLKISSLSKIFTSVLKCWYKYFIILQFIILFLVSIIFYPYFIFIATGIIVYYLLYNSFVYKNFGGYSGDMLGCFIETSELLIFIIMLVINLW